MKAVIIGGAGEQGIGVANELVKKGFDEVVVADFNLEKAKQVAGEVGPKAKAVFVNAGDHNSVVSLIEGADVVANTARLQGQWCIPVMKAAIEARVNYIDINDDFWIIESQFALDKGAKQAGITMLTGIGAMPGLTNICARRGADQLDRADSIKIAGAAFPGNLRRSGYWLHLLGFFTGTVPVFRDGKYTEVPAGSEPEVIDFLPPIGPWEVYVRKHGELGSLPHTIKGIKEVVVKGAYSVAGLSKLQRHLAQDLNFTSEKPVKVGDVSVKPFDFIREFIVSDEFCKTEMMSSVLAEQEAKRTTVGGAHWIEVKGLKGGKLARYVYREWQSSLDRTYPTRMPMAIAAHMIATGKIAQKGVIFPEHLDARQMLDEFAKVNISVQEKFEYL